MYVYYHVGGISFFTWGLVTFWNELTGTGTKRRNYSERPFWIGSKGKESYLRENVEKKGDVLWGMRSHCGHLFRANQRISLRPDIIQTALLFHHRIKMSVGQVGISTSHYNKHPRVKRVVFQMRAKPFVPRRHVKRVSTTCQLRKMAFFTSRDTVFTKIKKLLFT